MQRLGNRRKLSDRKSLEAFGQRLYPPEDLSQTDVQQVRIARRVFYDVRQLQYLDRAHIKCVTNINEGADLRILCRTTVDESPSLSKALLSVMTARGMSATDIAEKMETGRNRATLYRILSGATQDPKNQHLR